MFRSLLASALFCSALAIAKPPPPDLPAFEKALAPAFRPPAEFANDLGPYRSPLLFAEGTRVKTSADWRKRREEILKTWHGFMGPWPPVIEKPKVVTLKTTKHDGLTEHALRLEVAPGVTTEDAILLVPDGKGPFPAVVVVFYDAASGVGRGKPGSRVDFALQLARRGFVALSFGNAPAYAGKGEGPQPLSHMAYMAANCYQALANMPSVDAKRIGIVGHSYGGKWAMFASCLYEKFACAAWSDGGIVFDEKRSNVNYWEQWYLGRDKALKRKPGLVTEANPRTGAYKELVAAKHDLHELHALMAPRPFLVSGGSEDPPARWRALNHAVAVNRLLGYRDRVAMTNRKGHQPTEESNEQMCRFFEYFLLHGKALEKP